MLLALQFVGALALVGAVVALGGLVSGGIEDALGEKPLRDRAQEQD